MAARRKGDGGRATRAKKAEVREVDEQGIEEVKGGLTFEDGIVLTTTLLLVGCMILVIAALGRYPG